MSDHHSFNVEHATAYGLREAILIRNMHFWIGHNHANGKHQHDGRTWTYNSVKAFESLFPYLTSKQIRSGIEALVDAGVLLRGNYNNTPTDRTSWFAFSDSFLEANPLPLRAEALPCGANGNAQKGKTLIGTDVNQMKTADAGKPAAPASPARVSRGDKTLKTYLAECSTAETKAVPDDHYVRAYMKAAGITDDMAAIAWLRFKEDHTIGTRKAKRYTDWPAAFANSVKDRWYRLWLVNAEGEANWTNEGIQARRVTEAQQGEQA